MYCISSYPPLSGIGAVLQVCLHLLAIRCKPPLLPLLMQICRGRNFSTRIQEQGRDLRADGRGDCRLSGSHLRHLHRQHLQGKIRCELHSDGRHWGAEPDCGEISASLYMVTQVRNVKIPSLFSPGQFGHVSFYGGAQNFSVRDGE